VAYVPVQRVLGTLSSQQRHVPAKTHQSFTPLERWISEQPDEPPYHTIASVAAGCVSSTETTHAHFGQQLETISNQATAGSRGFGEEEGK
jgi:hypothetical protein